MYYIYILHCTDGRLYTGYTPDLKKRIAKHENDFVKATKARRPLKLIHYEAFISRIDAKKREVYLKGGNGKKEVAVMLEDYFKAHPWEKVTKQPETPLYSETPVEMDNHIVKF